MSIIYFIDFLINKKKDYMMSHQIAPVASGLKKKKYQKQTLEVKNNMQ